MIYWYRYITLLGMYTNFPGVWEKELEVLHQNKRPDGTEGLGGTVGYSRKWRMMELVVFCLLRREAGFVFEVDLKETNVTRSFKE